MLQSGKMYFANTWLRFAVWVLFSVKRCLISAFNLLEFRGNYSATSNNIKLVGRWWVGCYIWYSEEGTGRDRSLPRSLIAVPNVTAHPSTAIVPITILLYNSQLLCSFNVGIKGLIYPPSLSISACDLLCFKFLCCSLFGRNTSLNFNDYQM